MLESDKPMPEVMEAEQDSKGAQMMASTKVHSEINEPHVIMLR